VTSTPLHVLNELLVAPGGEILLAGSLLRVDGTSTLAVDGKLAATNAHITAANLKIGNDGNGEMRITGGTSSFGHVSVGYASAGTLNIAKGNVTTPDMVLGVLEDSAGTVNMNGGNLAVTNSAGLVIGQRGRGALIINHGEVSTGGLRMKKSVDNSLQLHGGALYVTNAAHNAVLSIDRGTLSQTGGTLLADTLVLTNADGKFAYQGGTLVYRQLIGNSKGIPPLLTFTQSGTNIVLSWSSLLAGVGLQQNETLNPATWTRSSFVKSVNGDTNSVVVSAGTRARYFKLGD
jgi:hypothetical protein